MRTDVKLGVVLSMVVVLAAGGYFLFGGKGEAPVPLTTKAAAKNGVPAKGPGGTRSTVPARPRQTLTNRDAASRPVVPPPDASKSDSGPNPGSSPGLTTPLTAPERVADSQPTATINAPSASPNTGSSAGSSIEPTGSSSVAASPSSPPSSGAESPGSRPSPTGSSLTSLTGPGSSSPTLPASTAEPTPAANSRSGATETHRVQPGDSLESLAQNYYGDRKYGKFLADSNPQIVNTSKPPVGTFVKIPPLPADADARIASSQPVSTRRPGAVAATTASGTRTYKVKPGDSFYRIAREQLGNASRWKELLALNRSAVKGDPTLLQVGQTLVLPES